MAPSELPPEVRQLVLRALVSIDHVAVLLAVRAAGADGCDVDAVAAWAGITPELGRTVLDDLRVAELVAPAGARWIFAPSGDQRSSVDSLADMYNTRPVTLVRAIYDRPSSAVQRFADAFLLRDKDKDTHREES